MSVLNPDSLMLGAAGGGFQVGDMLYQLVIFIILLVLLKIFAWKPIMGIMKKREQYIADEIDQAEQSNAEARKLAEEQREILKNSRQEIQTMMEEARKTADEKKEEIIAAARNEAQRLKESAKREIELEKEQAMDSVREQVASLSVLIASKVIEKELSEDDQEQLIKQYINEVGRA
ncbi:F0F1 ATP synthase subunit B [Priestia filamentosa]|uniref:ATP synthase subunit b n=1 Tax=Priestia filamentosa TaxID=1402861 RepID=A0A1X7FS23_9BACI|nr:F0F1 ATP synthase subunit B [Priestia filamentosa]AKO94778.1 ATP synthase F0 subunit B [Priestia filamentosa]MDT3765104.1 F0F1 ATP synthase subunit B [Priestia filamentosa]OXS66812.1 ATP synthase F0 subunit B [Priestia filamentosa]RJS66104.1 ATP synthase F0 subunit B [Priestia filamentosa]WCM15690.1 F0F1 ATP synthase subunit B [Priestia filamentosa]